MPKMEHLKNRPYIKGVIDALQEKQGIDREQATKQFLRYYRPMKRNWGFEPNAEEFAEKIIHIDRIVQRAKTGEGDGQIIRWTRKSPSVKVIVSPGVRISRVSEKGRRAILVRHQ